MVESQLPEQNDRAIKINKMTIFSTLHNIVCICIYFIYSFYACKGKIDKGVVVRAGLAVYLHVMQLYYTNPVV